MDILLLTQLKKDDEDGDGPFENRRDARLCPPQPPKRRTQETKRHGAPAGGGEPEPAMAATLARAALRALTRPRHAGAAGVPLQLDATAIAKQKTPGSLIGLRCTGTGAGGALQADEEAVVPRSVPVHIAYELHKAGHRYLDVRTESEFRAGHPERAVNIPYMFRTDSGLSKWQEISHGSN